MWGAGEEGQLGQDDLGYVSTPTFCDALRGQRICQVSCGAAITAAISVDGRVWVWGKLLRKYSRPTLVMDADDRVNQISCGSNNMAAWQGTRSPALECTDDDALCE
jgi:alpha-tubulin suppressor-like RCC1 family protein